MHKLWTAVLGCGLALAGSARGAEFSSLEERMSQTEFSAAGLSKLSPDELKTLNEWLRVHGLAPNAPIATGGGGTEFYPNDDARDVVETHIAGHFTGWMGKTVWAMDNGQVWQQAESGLFRDISLDNPAVRLKPMMLGSWLMVIDGCNCSLRVKRIK